MNKIILPNQWTPRSYQLPVLKYFGNGGKRAVSIWARRHGKDSTAINMTACAAHERVGLYWHMLPTLRQARKAIWNGIDKQGRRIIDQAFPLELRAKTRDDEMMIEFKNGSIWQCVGGDSYDALVGSNPCGVVFSEWSLMDPKAWDFIRPILTENGGWAWFIYTPRGPNHGLKLLRTAQGNPLWHHEIITIRDAGVLDEAAVIAEERASGMPEELIQQEYYCSFSAGLVGAVFAREIENLEKAGKITSVPYDPNYPVETAWDIGVRDFTSILFIQRVGYEWRIIDFYQNRNFGLDHYANVVNSRGYAYSRHIGPHDLAVREFGSGATTRRDIALNHGIHFDVAPKMSEEEGINAARGLLPRCVIDANKCADLVECLRNHKREWDEEKDTYSQKTVHDWTSHAAAALRYYAVMPDLATVTPKWMQPERETRRGPWRPPEMPKLETEDLADPLAEFR